LGIDDSVLSTIASAQEYKDEDGRQSQKKGDILQETNNPCIPTDKGRGTRKDGREIERERERRRTIRKEE
jgi:hypothetical protein